MLARKPLSEAVSFPVSAGVAAMAIGITVLKETGWNIGPLTMAESAFGAEPWRLVASALPHGGFIHLLFNVYWLWIFGAALEEAFGHVRLLALMVLFAAGSAAADYALFNGGIGLSGVGYGLFGMLYVLQKRDRRFVDAMDHQTAVLFVGWFFLCIGLTVAEVWSIANVAHGVGAILGGLAGLALAQPAQAPRHGGYVERGGFDLRIAGYAGFVAVMALSLLGGSLGRPYVNLSSHAGDDVARAAYMVFEQGDFEAALRGYTRATELDPMDASHWYNRGVAHQRLKQHQQAHDCFVKAALLEPLNAQYQSAAEGPGP